MASSIKDELKAALDRMPDDWPAEKVCESMTLYMQLLRSIDQSKRGEGYSLDEVREMVASWNTASSSPLTPLAR